MQSDDSSASNWFRDPAGLLSELRRGGATQRVRTNLPGYEHLYTVGHGGQGVVYAARQLSTRRQVAIKLLRDEPWTSDAAQLRFEREIQLAASLRHPHVVSVFDSGVAPDGTLFCVMEYIDGVPLTQYVESLRAEQTHKPGDPLGRLLDLFAQICDAVSYAHQRGVIHRDLKPKNILVDSAGQPHVVDFGLAKLTRNVQQQSVTRAGSFVGTLAYAAPELLEGDAAAADVRTDIYSLGVILYELLTGRLPHAATGSLADLFRAIQEREPEPPSRAARRAPAIRIETDLDAIVMTALAKDPARRYQSADALKRDVARYLAGEAVEAKRDSRWYVLRKTVKRHKAAALSASALVVMLAGFAVAMTVMYRRAAAAQAGEAAARQFAEHEAHNARQSLQFLQQVLGSASPSDAGREVTVRQALDAAAAQIASIPENEPELKAAACLTVGNTYCSLGVYSEGARHLELALNTLRDHLPDDHPDVAAACSNFAAALASLGRTDEAEVLYRQALEAYKKSPEENAKLIALTLLNLSGVLLEGGDLTEAKPVCREALAANRRLHAEAPHPDIALCLSNLGGLSLRKRDSASAAEFFTQALEMYRRTLGADHPMVAYSLDNLALACAGQQDHAQAEAHGRKAVEMRRRLLGEQHPDYAGSLYNLANVVSEQGRTDEAQALCTQALRVQKAALPPHHAAIARSQVLLGAIWLKRGAVGDAERQFASAYEPVLAQYGADSAVCRELRERIARAYESNGRAPQADAWRNKSTPPGD